MAIAAAAAGPTIPRTTAAEGPGDLYDRRIDHDERNNLFDDPSRPAARERLSRWLTERFDAETRPGTSGWDRPVTGFGQIQPVSRGIAAERSYAQSRGASDGIR